MKTLNKKLPALVNLPVEWTDEDWATPLIVQEPLKNRFAQPLAGSGKRLPHRCSRRARGRRAFTLIELLVVISIIGILAALLLPALGRVRIVAKIKAAKVDMNNIAAAASAYQAAYTLAPVPKTVPNPADYSFSETNTDIIVILMDVDKFANANHARNPEKHSFLNAGTLKDSTTAQGVSLIDYNFRDPWGNPYIMAFDLDYDNAVEVKDVPGGQNTVFEPYPYKRIPRSVLIWSKGPDGKADKFADPMGVNKDNIKGWD